MKISGTGILFCENTDYYSLIKAMRSNRTEEYDSNRKMTKEQASGKEGRVAAGVSANSLIL